MINVMICCDSLIIPVQSETLAVEGMAEFLRAFHRIKSHANVGLEIESILITMDNEWTRVSKRVKAQLQQNLGESKNLYKQHHIRHRSGTRKRNFKHYYWLLPVNQTYQIINL